MNNFKIIKYRFGYSNETGSLILQKKETFLNIFNTSKWRNISEPFKDVKTLQKISKRREINKIVIVDL